MTTRKLKYYKDKLSKWLLIITLLFSVFASSGYTGNFKSSYQQKVKTELVCHINNKTKKLADSKSTGGIYKNALLNNYHTYAREFLLTSNRLIKVKLVNVSKKYLFIKQADFFLHLKNIAQDSDNDPFISIG